MVRCVFVCACVEVKWQCEAILTGGQSKSVGETHSRVKLSECVAARRLWVACRLSHRQELIGARNSVLNRLVGGVHRFRARLDYKNRLTFVLARRQASTRPNRHKVWIGIRVQNTCSALREASARGSRKQKGIIFIIVCDPIRSAHSSLEACEDPTIQAKHLEPLEQNRRIDAVSAHCKRCRGALRVALSVKWKGDSNWMESPWISLKLVSYR